MTCCIRNIAAPILALILFPTALLARDGDLDPKFGTNQNGIERVSFDQGVFNRDDASDVLVLQDGSIVLVGTVDIGSVTGLGIARLTADGAPHPDGNTVITSSDFFLRATAVVQQSGDGMLVVAGSYFDNVAQEGPFWLVCRMTVEGEPDLAFGSDGVHDGCATGFADGMLTKGTINDVVVQPNGRIVAAGVYVDDNQIPRAALSALTPLGSADANFADDGMGADNLTMPFPQVMFSSSFRALQLGVGGRLVAAGAAAPDADSEFLVAVYDEDGDPAAGFGISGRVLLPVDLGPVGAQEDVAEGVVALADGRIIAAGSAQTDENSGSGGILFKLESNGMPDLTFNGSGRRVIVFGGAIIRFSDLAVDSKDRIVLTGTLADASTPFYSVVLAMRLTSFGGFDPTFFSDIGLNAFSFDTDENEFNFVAPSRATSVVLQGEHALIAGSVQGPINQFDSNFAVARLGDDVLFRNGFEAGL